MKTWIVDIETGPLAEQELAAMLPAFDPAEVKVGNLGPEKAAQKVAEAEAAQRRECFRKAALDPLTGRVLAIGMLELETDEAVILGDDSATAPGTEAAERDVLGQFWERLRGDGGRVHAVVGFNSHQFDLPFLVRRSWKHGVPVPLGVRRGRYWNDQFVDLREWWQLGDRQARGSLDAVARHLGVGEKTGRGADFARLWWEDRAMAEAYLENDLRLTLKVAQALGVIG